MTEKEGNLTERDGGVNLEKPTRRKQVGTGDYIPRLADITSLSLKPYLQYGCETSFTARI